MKINMQPLPIRSMKEIMKDAGEEGRFQEEKWHKEKLQKKQFKQNRILQNKKGKYIHALDTIIERSDFIEKNKNNDVAIDFYHFNFEDDEIELLTNFFEKAKKEKCFDSFELPTSVISLKFIFRGINLKKIRKYRDKFRKNKEKDCSNEIDENRNGLRYTYNRKSGFGKLSFGLSFGEGYLMFDEKRALVVKYFYDLDKIEKKDDKYGNYAEVKKYIMERRDKKIDSSYLSRAVKNINKRVREETKGEIQEIIEKKAAGKASPNLYKWKIKL